jgi:uncharacterized Zn finger protein
MTKNKTISMPCPQCGCKAKAVITKDKALIKCSNKGHGMTQWTGKNVKKAINYFKRQEKE